MKNPESRPQEEINSPETFRQWVVKEAEKAREEGEDYVSFYSRIEHQYLDWMKEGRQVESGQAGQGFYFTNQEVVMREALKLAVEQDKELFGKQGEEMSAEKRQNLSDFIHQLYDVYFEYESKIETLGDDREKRMYSEEALATTEEVKQKVIGLLQQYKEKNGDYKVLDEIYAYAKELAKLTHGGTEISKRMTEDGRVTNRINYAWANPQTMLFNATSAIQGSMEREYLTGDSQFNQEIPDIHEFYDHLRQLFGADNIRGDI